MAQAELTNRSDAGERPIGIGAASIWMVGISAVLFFIPAVNGLIGGFVGGYKVGSPKRAVIAAILPAALVAGLSWLLLGLFDAPIIGFFSGIAVLTLIVFSSLGLLVGAVLGGAISAKH